MVRRALQVESFPESWKEDFRSRLLDCILVKACYTKFSIARIQFIAPCEPAEPALYNSLASF